MVQSLHSAVFDQRAGVSNHTTRRTADVGVDLEDLLDGLGHDQRGVQSPFYGQNDALRTLDADGR